MAFFLLRRKQNNFLRTKQGQTFLEFAVLFVVIVGALIAMRSYIQRSIQGRWRDTTESLGGLYDPQATRYLSETMSVNSQTIMQVETDPETQEKFTTRTDTSNMHETKTDTITIHH